jgi:hypothetical protein
LGVADDCLGIIEDHPGVVENNPQVVEDQPGVVEDHHGVVEIHHGDVEIHHGVTYAYSALQSWMLEICLWDIFSIKQAEFICKLVTSLCHPWNNHIFFKFNKIPFDVLPILT